MTEITLKNGRLVKHRPMSNGATEGYMADGGTMSNEEWTELCELRRLESTVRIKTQQADRLIRNKEAQARLMQGQR